MGVWKIKNQRQEQDIISKIKMNFSSFSRGQQRIAQQIFNNANGVIHMTAAKLGAAAGVSESTVVRFANQMGYKGYPEFLESLRLSVNTSLNTAQRLEAYLDQHDDSDSLLEVFKNDINSIKTTAARCDVEEINHVVKQLFKAETVYIIGANASASITFMLGYYLSFILPNIKVITPSAANISVEQIIHITNKDLLFAIAFPRYSKSTIHSVEFAYRKGASIVALTDNANSPIVQYANHCLYAAVDNIAFVGSNVAPISMINAIIVAATMYNKKETVQLFEEMSKINQEFEMFA